MQTFQEYITEGKKNMHLTHVEDVIFLDGPNGALRALYFLDSIIRMLTPDLKESKITLKWDGAPAIVAGIDPESGKFFVGTKSVFNKTPKLNFTNADIEKNHGHAPGLVEKLKVSLKYLPKIWKGGVYQGDMMFAGGDLKKTNIDGEPHYTFTPNTITYATPVDSELGKALGAAKMGIVWHTKYTGGPTMADTKAAFNVSKSEFKNSKDVWFDDAEFKDVSTTATFTPKEANVALSEIAKMKRMLPQIRVSVKKMLQGPNNMVTDLIIYNNFTIRTGQGIANPSKHFDGFVEWWIERHKKKSRRFSDADEASLRKSLIPMKRDFVAVFEFYNSIKEIKKVIISRLNKIKSLKTFLQTDSGYKVVGHEGYVAITKSGSSVKLVDRMEFSKNNFMTNKNWS